MRFSWAQRDARLEGGLREIGWVWIVVLRLKKVQRCVLAVVVEVYRVQCSSREVVEDGRAGFHQLSRSRLHNLELALG